jgi:hypothetical protein
MQHQHHADISETFHSKRVDSQNLILVVNTENYVMAEYSRKTGETVWHRLVNVSQRERVEQWLGQNYPSQPISAPKTPPSAGTFKRTAKK